MRWTLVSAISSQSRSGFLARIGSLLDLRRELQAPDASVCTFSAWKEAWRSLGSFFWRFRVCLACDLTSPTSMIVQ